MRSASLLALAFVAVAACSPGPGSASTPAAGEELPDRDPALACELVREQQAVLLDVRSEREFEGGHLEGAVLVPHDELAGRLAEIEALTGGDRSRPIVTYCRSGHRAGIAKETLLGAGYTRVTNLGGIKDWTGC